VLKYLHGGVDMSEYNKLDLSKIKFADEVLSMDDVLKDVTPIEFPEDVLLGTKKISITTAEKDYE
jgi:hypothetical protein